MSKKKKIVSKIVKAIKVDNKKSLKVEPEKVEIKKTVSDILELPYYNKDFTKGSKKNAKRSLILAFFLVTSFNKEVEINVKDILFKVEKYKRENIIGVAPTLASGKVKRYLLGLKKPKRLRIVELEPKTFKNSKGGDSTLITRYKITPLEV